MVQERHRWSVFSERRHSNRTFCTLYLGTTVVDISVKFSCSNARTVRSFISLALKCATDYDVIDWLECRSVPGWWRHCPGHSIRSAGLCRCCSSAHMAGARGVSRQGKQRVAGLWRGSAKSRPLSGLCFSGHEAGSNVAACDDVQSLSSRAFYGVHI